MAPARGPGGPRRSSSRPNPGGQTAPARCTGPGPRVTRGHAWAGCTVAQWPWRQAGGRSGLMTTTWRDAGGYGPTPVGGLHRGTRPPCPRPHPAMGRDAPPPPLAPRCRGLQEALMPATRLSRLQQQILRWLQADARRSHGVMARSPQARVQAVPSAQGHSSHRRRLLDMRGLIRLGRSPGGRAAYVTLTTAGRQKAAQLTGSDDSGIPVSGTRMYRLPCRSHLPSTW